jgi:hypothetical protein
MAFCTHETVKQRVLVSEEQREGDDLVRRIKAILKYSHNRWSETWAGILLFSRRMRGLLVEGGLLQRERISWFFVGSDERCCDEKRNSVKAFRYYLNILFLSVTQQHGSRVTGGHWLNTPLTSEAPRGQLFLNKPTSNVVVLSTLEKQHAYL